MELQEGSQIHQSLQPGRTSSLHDLKATVKTWRNRLPVIADDLSHWSDIFTWRQHHYQNIINHLQTQSEQGSSVMLGVHASAQTMINFGKIARKHNLFEVCHNSLIRIYTIPEVPLMDCFQKIREEIKCYLQSAAMSENKSDGLNRALEVIGLASLGYFNREMISELYALKGLLLSKVGKSEEANAVFSEACQLYDTLIKAWAYWGDYLEQIFTKDPKKIDLGVSAMTCFLHACRQQVESKSRKYLAKVLWLLLYDDDKGSLMNALDKYAVGIPPLQWLPWIPQLLCCLVQYEGTVILNILSQVGRMFPQAVYFPIRTLYLTLKIETKTQAGNGAPAAEAQPSTVTVSTQPGGVASQQNEQTGQTGAQGSTQTVPIRATPQMWRCSKIMHLQRDIHPTVLSSLEGIVDQMVWFRENWYEEVLRQLRQGLAKCYAIAFENRASVKDATITPHTLNFVKKLVSTFGIGIGESVVFY